MDSGLGAPLDDVRRMPKRTLMCVTAILVCREILNEMDKGAKLDQIVIETTGTFAATGRVLVVVGGKVVVVVGVVL